MGSAKRKNTRIRRMVKSGDCVACGASGSIYNPIDPAHVRSFKISQNDEPWNLTPLCRKCHTLQHQFGWIYLIVIYSNLARDLEAKGWEFTKLADGSFKMSNAKEVELNEMRRGNG